MRRFTESGGLSLNRDESPSAGTCAYDPDVWRKTARRTGRMRFMPFLRDRGGV
jgi:hypothetical protein